jgi:hypothetical protein
MTIYLAKFFKNCIIYNLYFGKWNFKWSTIKEIIPYFNKITEEHVDTSALARSANTFLIRLAEAYIMYGMTSKL